MAELKVSFTLGERDLKHFRRVMAKAIDVANPDKEKEVTAAAVSLIEKARGAEPPDYVRERLDRLERIVAMSYDDEWKIPEVVRRRVMAALLQGREVSFSELRALATTESEETLRSLLGDLLGMGVIHLSSTIMPG